MTELELTTDELTEAVYGTENGVVGPRFISQPECKELLQKCEKLLSLEGLDALTGLDLAIVEVVRRDVELVTDEDMDIVNDLYEQREREAALRGEKWEVMP
jgi:hypothetical protein